MQNLDFDNMNINELAVALKLDQEEEELLASIENNDWVSVSNLDQEIQRFQAIAIQKVARQKIEFQISGQDADHIYGLANQLGKSVSGFAQEIIHKYLQGELIFSMIS